MTGLGLGLATQAATLISGGNLTPPPLAPGPVGATLVASSSVNFSAPFSFSGVLLSQVFSNDPNSPFVGGLTFTYELTMDNVFGAQSASRMTVSSFDGFQTDVSYTAGTASFGVIPSSVTRTSVGDLLRFNFDDGGGNGTLAPGVNSVKLVVRTDAVGYQNTLAGIINGSAATVTSFAPVVIPEPSSATLCILGGAAILALAMSRRRQI